MWTEFPSMIEWALQQHLMNAESTAVYACAAECLCLSVSACLRVTRCISWLKTFHHSMRSLHSPSLTWVKIAPHTHTHTHTGAECLGIWRSGVVNEQEVVSSPWTKWGFFFSNCRHYWGKDWGIFFKTQNLLKEAPMWEPTLSSLGQTWVLQDKLFVHLVEVSNLC